MSGTTIRISKLTLRSLNLLKGLWEDCDSLEDVIVKLLGPYAMTLQALLDLAQGVIIEEATT
jgi:hypothetical protein